MYKFRLSETDIEILSEKFEQGTLVFNDKYQRKPKLWDAKFRSYLVSTVLHGFPIPPIIIHKRNGGKIWECIDGHQRTSTLLDYLGNKFKVSGKLVEEELLGKRFMDLPKKQRDDFTGYPIAVLILENVSERQIREVFTRINSKTEMLNVAERRHGKYEGVLKDVINELANQYAPRFLDQKIISPKEDRRMKSRDMIAQIFAHVLLGKIHFYQTDIDEMIKDNKESFRNRKVITDRVKEAIETVLVINQSIGYGLLKNHNFVSLVCAVYMNRWAGIDIGVNYESQKDYLTSNEVIARKLRDILEAKRKKDLEGKYADFVIASMRTTDSRVHRQKRAVYFLEALQSN